MFLHCYRNPAHERQVKAFFEQKFPQLFVSASHELSQEYREFERCSTVVANAYIGPRVRQYLGEMEVHLKTAGFAGVFFDRTINGRTLRGGAGPKSLRPHARIRSGRRSNWHTCTVSRNGNSTRHRF